MKLLKNKKIYTGKSMVQGYIRFDKTIFEINDMKYFTPNDNDIEIIVDGQIVIPGFIDIHSHGGYGFDCMDSNSDQIDYMVKQMTIKEGITSYFCTTVTQSFENIEKSIINIEEASKKNKVIAGIHLEGPFISKNFKGAQNEEYIKKADKKILEYWNSISNNKIRLLTYAPEETSYEFENWCLSNGIILSAGHSNATYEQLCKSSTSHITHLYNAQRGLNHRELGVTGYGLLTDGVNVEIICDGIHINPQIINMTYKLKGSDQIELITDSMSAKGINKEKSNLGGQIVYLKDNIARLEDGTIAGSTLKYIDAFKNIIKFTDISINEAVNMTSVNQAKKFGLIQKGEIKKGKDSDFVIIDNNYDLKATISMGELYINI